MPMWKEKLQKFFCSDNSIQSLSVYDVMPTFNIFMKESGTALAHCRGFHFGAQFHLNTLDHLIQELGK